MKHFDNRPLDAERLLGRREFLRQMGTGLGSIALACLLMDEAHAHSRLSTLDSPLSPKPPHFTPRAKRVVQIFCPGAVSHLDTFEYKPELTKRHGQPLPGAENLITFQGGNGSLMKSPWDWKRHGQCGKWVSDLLPALADCVDDIAFIH